MCCGLVSPTTQKIVPAYMTNVVVGAKVGQQQQLECWCWANMSARQYGRVALSINQYLTLARRRLSVRNFQSMRSAK